MDGLHRWHPFSRPEEVCASGGASPAFAPCRLCNFSHTAPSTSTGSAHRSTPILWGCWAHRGRDGTSPGVAARVCSLTMSLPFHSPPSSVRVLQRLLAACTKPLAQPRPTPAPAPGPSGNWAKAPGAGRHGCWVQTSFLGQASLAGALDFGPDLPQTSPHLDLPGIKSNSSADILSLPRLPVQD